MVLLIWIGVGSCGWTFSVRVMRITLASLAFRKSAPSSASAADAATNFRMLQREEYRAVQDDGFSVNW